MNLSRRQWMEMAIAGAAGMAAAAPKGHEKIIGDPRVRGPFPILSTPYTEAGAVDYEVLARGARFADWCESPGLIWPQSGDSVDLLTMEEKLKGMDVLAEALRHAKHTALCLGVQGKDTEEMLVYARHVEKLAPPCIISRPPDSGKTEEDLLQYWRALGAVAKRPVIIQTTGGAKYHGKAPSVKLMTQLAREFPQSFGYIKEEAGDVMARQREEIAAKPVIKRVMSAAGGFGWLHQARQLGTEGLITERVAYADLLAKMWKLMDSGEDNALLNDLFSKYLLMLNLKTTIKGNELRGFHLYILQKRGVFKNRLSREYAPKNASSEKPVLQNLELKPDEIAELDSRFDSLQPFLKNNGNPAAY